MSACEMSLNYGPCPRAAVAVVTGGCVHEHVSTRRMCTPCLEAAKVSQTYCRDCRLGPEPHTHCLKVVRSVEGLVSA